MIVEQIVEFASINFVHRHSNSKVPLVILPVVNASLEQILNSHALKTVHRISFTRASLSIGENSDDSLVENEVKNWPNLIEI